MAWIRMGGGSNANPDIRYLYKDGKQNIEWDNGLYHHDTAYTLAGGWDFDETNVNSTINIARNEKSFTSAKPIDVTEYSKICILYNNTSKLEMDVSSLTVSGYLGIFNVAFEANNTLSMVLSNTKNNAYNNRITFKDIGNLGRLIRINRIWLEK